MSHKGLILASASRIRQTILSQAGIDFIPVSPDFNEDAMKQTFMGSDYAQLAVSLAEGKAHSLANTYPEAYILGADQIMTCEGQAFDKPKTRQEAKERLLFLRDKTHELLSGMVIIHDGKTVFSYRETTTLTMRPFSDAFLETYLDKMGDRISYSVGGYEVENIGIQLFSKIEGDHFSILGLPLLPLLSFLQEKGLSQT